MASAMGSETQPLNVGNRTNIIVNYLPESITDEDFRKMFEMFGTLKTSKLSKDRNTGKSECFGFLEFEKPADAAKAIENVNGLQLGRTKLRVAYAKSHGEMINRGKVYVHGIPGNYRESHVEEMFKRFGTIEDIRILKNEKTHRPKGMAVIYFEKRIDAEKAIAEMDGTTPPGKQRTLDVRMVQKDKNKFGKVVQIDKIVSEITHVQPQIRYRPVQSYVAPVYNSNACVFVYNIGEFITEHELYRLFSPFGGIQTLNIVRDTNTGQCKGYGFITFCDRFEAEAAIITLNGMIYNGRQLQVRFKDGLTS